MMATFVSEIPILNGLMKWLQMCKNIWKKDVSYKAKKNCKQYECTKKDWLTSIYLEWTTLAYLSEFCIVNNKNTLPCEKHVTKQF